LRVEILPFQSGAVPVPAGGPPGDQGVTILSAQLKGKGRQVLVFGYPDAVMQEVVVVLTRCRPELMPKD
jgi:hypothetical protein